MSGIRLATMAEALLLEQEAEFESCFADEEFPRRYGDVVGRIRGQWIILKYGQGAEFFATVERSLRRRNKHEAERRAERKLAEAK